MKILIWIVIQTYQLLFPKVEYDYVPTVEEYVSPHDYEPQLMHVTGYINPNHNKTADGSNTFVGSCAMNRANLGKVIALYDKEKNFIGYFDVNDVGGTQGLKDGKVVDLFFTDMETLNNFFEEHGTKLYVQIIDSNG